MFFNGAKRQRAERVCKFQFFNFLEGSYIVPTWLTIIFSIIILLGIFAWIGLSIFQKIKQIRGKKKDKKIIERKEDKK
ncbi:hypothetical protein [Spiroplasma kunkelii]|uniref:Spiroplasmavirus-related protein n=1 Tax=Spiroplasma phage SkV1CR23x TaxID=2789014 RepID=A8RHI0_9VIRU|nr:hypothetical protein [Spiroplasma kunkelii]YP_001552214.1 hypothetical protein SkV1VCR23x_ORF12 [Vespertiliovirus SkV1CR23x]ABU40633.1 unknown [Spiroplasma phage SkV1CR23x]